MKVKERYVGERGKSVRQSEADKEREREGGEAEVEGLGWGERRSGEFVRKRRVDQKTRKTK